MLGGAGHGQVVTARDYHEKEVVDIFWRGRDLALLGRIERCLDSSCAYRKCERRSCALSVQIVKGDAVV